MHTNITQTYNRTPVAPHARGRLWCFGLALVASLLLLTSVVSAVTQGYRSDDSSISKGMAVAVASGESGQDGVIVVEKTSVAQASKSLGVVVDPQGDTVTLSGNSSQLFVATTGTAQVYVTDLNGAVKKGDLLTPSPLKGILMKAPEGSRGVLGAALEDFPTSNTQTVTITGANDKPQEVKVALLQLNMDVKFSSNNKPAEKPLLERIGETIVKREVSSAQVVIALFILTLLVIVEGGVIYGAISSSMISLGRNPLAKKTIMRGLIQISGLVVLVLIVGLGAVYLVLWV